MISGLKALASLIVLLMALGEGGPTLVAAANAYEVRVLGSAELELEAVGAGTNLNVRGQLVDDLGRGLAQRRVDLLVENERRATVNQARVYTDFQGRFSWSSDEVPGSYVVTASFAGSEHLPASRSSASVRLVAEPVVLEVQVPSFVYGEAEVFADFQASSAGQGVATFVSVYRAGEAVAAAQLDTYGRTRLDLQPFVELGDNAFEFVIEGTAYREAVRVAQNVRRGDQIEVVGRVERVFLRMRRGWEMRLQVDDERGGVPDLDVRWRVRREGEDPVEFEGKTDASGMARYFVESRAGAQGIYEVDARVLPPAGAELVWPGERWEVEEAPGEKALRLAAMVAVLLALVWVGRGVARRAGVMMRAWWGRLRAHRARARTPEDAMARDMASGLEELELEERSEAQDESLDPALTLVVELWDRWRDRGIEGATLSLTGADETTIAHARELGGGAYALSLSHSATSTLSAAASGFVDARATLERGRSGRLRLKMSPVPLKIRELYRWLVRRAHGEDLWGTLTPAQIARALARQQPVSAEVSLGWSEALEGWTRLRAEERPAELLRLLTAAVEETNFSGRDYDVALWHRVREIVLELDRLVAFERGALPPGAP
ncbi:carboxypeptidase regulatory-like domain-containing protein [Lujinxingia sediminis]|uniref:Carboxypeptidase regulatory-like domain-containing protein n=1 Tax=Lujinxingia sediminis TaxID=2480984 RepID=A0ABY0CYY1_9DELT|nr:carboxypeptidase-like regulatory domain-containing protein [Lujinxingia sediminis]RVU48895.1 carboxypeptidase regulatory-like domain-containing protein [Lujinxingia sediminis]